MKIVSLVGLTVAAVAIAQSGMSQNIPVTNNAMNIMPETPTLAQETSRSPEGDRTYWEIIRRTAEMVSDSQAQSLVAAAGLNILNITWEDTARYYDSAVGPNISDMTIQVQQRDPETGDYRLHLMPVIRYPNFSDRTADVPLEQFFLLVGNESGQPLQRVSLREFLGNLRRYLHQPDSWRGESTSLLANRDTHVLVSAQACFLPVPQDGTADFNPVLFNYQSYKENPAVLTILATREGTSVTIIDNERDAFTAGATWGQRLFFNQNGERASLTGQRISDFRAGGGDSPPPTDQAAGESGLNMVMLIQVPLLQPERQRLPMASGIVPAAPLVMESVLAGRSDVEEAVIGHGNVEGPFTEIDNLPIQRDTRYPIRVTVQFYKATSNGVVDASDVQQIQQQIARVYEDGDYVGSLVVDGRSNRPTEYEGDHQEPANWWTNFWEHYERQTGRSPADVLELLRWLRGEDQTDD